MSFVIVALVVVVIVVEVAHRDVPANASAARLGTEGEVAGSIEDARVERHVVERPVAIEVGEEELSRSSAVADEGPGGGRTRILDEHLGPIDVAFLQHVVDQAVSRQVRCGEHGALRGAAD